MFCRFFILIVLLTLSACSRNNSPSSNDFSKTQSVKQKRSEALSEPKPEAWEKWQESNFDKKIIYNASMLLSVSSVDSANNRILEIAQQYEGYLQQMTENRTTIRVKSLYLNKAVSAVSGLGKVEDKVITGDDITEEYNDLQTKLDNAEKTRQRYLELLAKAHNVTETLLVEKELERISLTIDEIKGKLSKYEHLTSYSTLTVNFKSKTKPGVVGYVFVGLFKAVKWLFVRG